ncbi:hypothetical protein EDD21DRAFT_78520 [Dissophora ornata]|nr:hypothetical protein EDD21DRAFT_78520 [Dissophora ornata]
MLINIRPPPFSDTDERIVSWVAFCCPGQARRRPYSGRTKLPRRKEGSAKISPVLALCGDLAPIPAHACAVFVAAALATLRSFNRRAGHSPVTKSVKLLHAPVHPVHASSSSSVTTIMAILISGILILAAGIGITIASIGIIVIIAIVIAIAIAIAIIAAILLLFLLHLWYKSMRGVEQAGINSTPA